MRPDARLTALRLAVLLKRSGKSRARISDKTFRLAGERTTLRDAFVIDVRHALEDLGILVLRISRGGFALITADALEGAPAILIKHLMTDMRKLKEDDLWKELDLEKPDDEE